MASDIFGKNENTCWSHSIQFSNILFQTIQPLNSIRTTVIRQLSSHYLLTWDAYYVPKCIPRKWGRETNTHTYIAKTKSTAEKRVRPIKLRVKQQNHKKYPNKLTLSNAPGISLSQSIIDKWCLSHLSPSSLSSSQSSLLSLLLSLSSSSSSEYLFVVKTLLCSEVCMFR